MGTIKYRKKIVLYSTILLMSFSSLLNVNASFKGQNERIAPEDLEQYVVVEDPFDRSFFGGILQRAKIRINEWFNGEGTIYENTTLDSITINGYTLSMNEIKNNPSQLKEFIADRDEEVGLEDIEVTNNTQDKYEYKEYLDLLIKNAQPMQIVSDTTWTKESGPYYISGEVQVMKGATLTIEAGTEVYFRSMPSTKYRSGILVDGELILKGTESEQIKLAPYGTDATSGSWKGIYVTERGSLNAEHTVIEKAGGWTESAIYSYGPVTLNKVDIQQTKGSAVTAFSDAIITNSLFKDNEKYGIDLYRYNQAFETVVTSNKIEGNKTAGRIIIRQTKIPNYDVSDNTATSTDLNGFVLGGDIIGDMSFTQPGKNLPYVLMNTLGVYGEIKPFTIYPKSEVDFTDTVIKVVATPKLAPEHGIVINGTLNLNNSTITSLRDNTVASTTNRTDNVAPSNRDWSGLVVGESGTLNINQSTIKYAKEAIYTHGSIYLNGATIKNVFSGIQGDGKFVIHDSTFTNLEAPAFRYYAGKEPLDISVRNSTFTNINDVLGKVQVYQSGGELDLVNLKANQVKKHGVELTGSFNIDTTISQPGKSLPYLIPQLVINKSAKIDVTGKTVLKVEDGLLMGYKAGIDVYGQLNLTGTSSTNRVTVTSLRDDTIGGDSNGDGTSTKPSAGDWGSINYHSSSKNRDSQIIYSDIKYGGDHHQGYAIGGEGKFNIQHSQVVDSSEAGIGVLGTITIENSSLERNHGYGVHVRSNNNFSVTMNDNHFKDNLDYAAFVEFGSTLDHIEVSGNEASNNKVNGVGITGTVRYDLGLLPAGDKFPYVVPNTLVIEEGSSLTLNPKTVVKFQQPGQLDVYGNLVLKGTDANNKVQLTSVKNDNIAGDTNNDGSQSTAQNGDWKSVNLYPNSKNNQKIEITHSIISYGGSQEKDYMIGGEGELIVKNSEIKNSSSNALSPFSKLVLIDSIIKDNSKNGVYISGNTLTNIFLEKNKFNNNTESATLMNFTTPNDKISGNSNSATNNGINGISITGNIDEDNTFVKLGDKFPYVVDDTFTINPNYSLNLSEEVVIKFDQNAKLDVEGHLKTNGTSDNKVYFTSLMDDSIAGDTNNDAQNSEAQDEDWEGIIYHAESEGTFNHFECKYSTLNMDYAKIPYLKVVSNGDNQVAAIDNYFAYVQKNNEDYQVVLYDINKKTEKVLSSSSNKIKNVILDNSSNIINVAWLEEGRMFVNNGGGNHSQQLFTDYQNISYFHLMGNNIVFINGGSIYYGDIGNGAVHKLENASLKFTPLVSNQYLFYLNKESNMIHRLVLDGTKSEHYVMSLYENVITGDIYGNDIAFLASHEDALNKEIIIGDIPSWTAIQIPGNNYNYHNLSLYKDKLSFTLNKDLTARKELYISESSSNNDINIISTINDSYFTIGYSNFDQEIGNKSLIFSDDDLIYLVETTIGTKDETYVHQGNNNNNNNSYDREISLGSNFQIGLGATASAYGVNAGLNFNISKEGNLSYKLHHNSLNSTNKLTLGREIINGVKLGADLSIGLNKYVSVAGVGATTTGTTLNKDQYTYSLHEEDSYKNIGLLSGAGILNYLTSNNLSLQNILLKAISNVIETAVNPNESSQAYTSKSGIGLETSVNSYLGLKVGKKYVSFGVAAEAGLNSTSYAEVGVEKIGVEEEESKFVSIKSGKTAKFSTLLGFDDKGQLPVFKTGFSIHHPVNKLLPMLSKRHKEEVGLEIQTSINSNKELTLTFTDFSETLHDYQLSHTFIIPNALEVNKKTGLLKGINEFYNNIDTVNDENENLASLLISNESIVMGYLDDLVKLIDKDVLIKYEVRLTKGNPKTTAKLVDKFGKIYEQKDADGTVIGNLSPLVSLNGKSNDIISFVVDSGRFKNGAIIDENPVIAYIPVEDTSIWGIIGQIFNEFKNQINPHKIEFNNNKVNYENICITVPNNLAHEAVLISTPIDIKNDVNGRFEINENQYIVDDFIYIDVRNSSGNSITSYPDNSKLEFMIPNKYLAKKDYAAIYEYDEHNDDWIKRGGKITKNTDGTYSINIEINESGQYALGFDTSQPKIEFSYKDRPLNSGMNVSLYDYIDIEIIDSDLPLKEVTVKLTGNGQVITENYYSSSFSHYIDGEVGKTYKLEISYKDKFENVSNASIYYKIIEPEVVLVEEGSGLVKDNTLQESHDMTNDLGQNEIELHPEDNHSDEVTTNPDEGLIESE